MSLQIALQVAALVDAVDVCTEKGLGSMSSASACK